MAYTHIQCIGYRVPTVAKVFDNTPPTVHNLEMPNEAGAPLPTSDQVFNPVTGNIVYTYYIDNGTYRLYEPPVIDYNIGSDFLAWKGIMESYMHTLMQYLENLSANNYVISEQWRAIITYLKYYNLWKDWTIPSATPNGADIGITKILDKSSNLYVDAYTLRDTDGSSLALLDQAGNTDTKNRIIRFLNVLYYAATRNDNAIDKRETTLKVFTAPEFYFRPETPIDANYPEGNYRAYTQEVYEAIKTVLRQTIKSINLNHWLIVPGTIMWYVPKGIEQGNKLLNTNIYFNSCIYIWQSNADNYISNNLEKAKASQIDGVPWGHAYDSGANAPAIFNGYRSTAQLNKHLFTLNGVKTGLEICLEHEIEKKYILNNGILSEYYIGVLANRVNYNLFSIHLGQRRHLQLLVSGGMSVNLPSIVLDNQSVFFRNDGLKAETVTVEASTENKYVDARTNTTVPVTDHTHLTSLASLQKYTLNGYNNYQLKSPVTGNLQLQAGTMPFDQQNIIIFSNQKI